MRPRHGNFRHGAHHRAMTRATAPRVGPTRGSQPGAQAGRHPESTGEKNGGEWRFFEGQKRHFSVIGAKPAKRKPLIWMLLCKPAFLCPRARKMAGAIFGRGDFRRDPEAVCASATDLANGGRHGDFEQALRERKIAVYRRQPADLADDLAALARLLALFALSGFRRFGLS